MPKKHLVLCITFLIMLISFNPSIVYAKSATEKNVLFLSPFNPDYPVVKEFEKGTKNLLIQNTQYKFNYFYEYLDLPHHSGEPGYFEGIANYLKHKYQNYQPDFIITQANMLPLLDNYGDDLFSGIPMIIEQDEDGLPIYESNPNYYFIHESTEAFQNIELILKLRPMVKKIYVIIGDSVDEQIFLYRLMDIEKQYNSRVEFINLNTLPYSQMIDVVKNAGFDSAILYFRWLRDSKGESFVPEQVIYSICNEAKTTVFGTDRLFLGSGILGGYVRNEQNAGELVGNVLLSILSGQVNPTQKVIPTVPNTYVFDWRQMHKWGINEQQVPSNSAIEYKKLNMWEQYGYTIIGIIALLILQALLIFTLLLNKGKRLKAERDLSSLNISLEKTVLERTHDLSKANDQLRLAQKKLEALNKQLDLNSRTDSLTGLFNRRHAEEKVQEEFEKFRRNGRGFILVLADIDFFKRVNDQYGHDIGDFILKSISQILSNSVRIYDTIARWGGEEFLLLFPDTNEENARLLVERIRKTIEEQVYSYQEETFSITMTFGLTEIKTNDLIVDVLKRADTALYHGKNSGRNCVVTA